MSKVYIVTDGDYSDYRIRAVFSTRKAAEEFVATRTVSTDIEEWGMDLPREELPGCWCVIVKADGTVWSSRYEEWAIATEPARKYGGSQPRFMGFGTTEEHARRSAEQLRRETIALNKLPMSDGLGAE